MSEEMTENEYRKLRDEDGEISIAAVKMSLADHNALVAERDALRDERDELKQTLNEWSDQYTMVVSGKCPPDEYHCACVPALREEIIRLRAMAKLAEELINFLEPRTLILPRDMNCLIKLTDDWEQHKALEVKSE